MKYRWVTTHVAAGLALVVSGCAVLSSGNAGKNEYQSNCAACHGKSGKGDGPKAASLPVRPANLTLLAKRNGGIFPADRVRAVIDGRTEVAAHGSREMPVWAMEFQVVPPNQPQPMSEEPFGFRENTVQARINALVDYLQRLQGR